MEEKRKLRRKSLSYYLRVFDVSTNQPIGDAVNMTTEGILLISDHPIETNAIFRLRMSLPKGIYENGYLEFTAESKWWEKGFIPDSYNVGFQLKNMSQKGIQVIESLLEKFC